MSCYFLYTMTPVVEVALVPTGYVLGHALSSVQQSASSNHHNILLRSEKYPHEFPSLPSSLDIARAPDLVKPIHDSTTRPTTRHFQRRRKRGSHVINGDVTRRHVRRHRVRHSLLEAGSNRERLIEGPSSLEVVAGKPLLYCDLCRVKLNAALQAKQHFEGKTHAKKVKLAQMCSKGSSYSAKTNTITNTTGAPEDEVTSSSSSSSSPSSSSSISGSELPAPTATAPAITGPDIFCAVCGISFNSDKQSKQHYRGKLHAKKQRLANHLSRCAARKRLRAMVQDEGRQRMGRVTMDAKENHTPDTRDSELSDARTVTC